MTKEEDKYKKPDAYFEETMKLLTELKAIIRDEAPAQAKALFATYNKIVSSADAVKSKDTLRTELAGIQNAFDTLNKRIIKMKEPAMAPFSLKVTIGASREKGKKHLHDCSLAAQALNRYLDSGDKAELKTAADLLGPLAV
jgi:hypothetical protein